MTLPLLAAATAGCALVFGFEDHEPFPSDTQQGGMGGSGASGGRGGAMDMGGMGGDGGVPVEMVEVLLIPDRTEDAVGMYSPTDGAYIRDLVPPLTGNEPYALTTPQSAAQGPDGLIYLTDQIDDLVVRFNQDGSFESIVADASDGLDNVRGIDFRDGLLYVSNAPAAAPAVLTFDLQGNRLADHVTGNISPFDVLFLSNGTMMMADLVLDAVLLFDVDGGAGQTIFVINFPQQVHTLQNGNFVVAADDEIVEFEIDGDRVRSVAMMGLNRGVIELDNGHWLVAHNGIDVFNPFSGEIVSTSRVGGSYSKVERAMLPASVVTP